MNSRASVSTSARASGLDRRASATCGGMASRMALANAPQRTSRRQRGGSKPRVCMHGGSGNLDGQTGNIPLAMSRREGGAVPQKSWGDALRGCPQASQTVHQISLPRARWLLPSLGDAAESDAVAARCDSEGRKCGRWPTSACGRGVPAAKRGGSARARQGRERPFRTRSSQRSPRIECGQSQTSSRPTMHQ